MKIPSLLLVCCGLYMTACSNSRSNSDTSNNTPIEHTATNNQMVGKWKYKDLDFDFKINIDLPGIEDNLKTKMKDQLKQQMGESQIEYKPDGTFEVNSPQQNNKGKYKIENNELIHTDFTNQTNVMNFSKANIDGNILTLQVTGDQFWKMLESIPEAKAGVEEMKKMLTVNQITYTFEKI